MLCGYVFVRLKWLPAEAADLYVAFVYKVAGPALIFLGLATLSLSQIFHWGFMLATIVSISLCMFPWFFIIKKRYPEKKPGFAALVAYSVSLGNSAFIALPILLVLIGKIGMVLCITSLFIVVALFMPFVFYYVSQKKNRQSTSMVKDFFINLKSLFQNPLLIGAVLGILYSVTTMPMPAILSNFFHSLAIALTPLALFSIGMSFSWASVKKHWKMITIMTIFKMFVAPAIAYGCAAIFRLNFYETLTIVLIAGVPAPKTAFILAENFDYEPELFSGVIAATTLVGVATIFVYLLFATLWFPHMFLHSVNHAASMG